MPVQTRSKSKQMKQEAERVESQSPIVTEESDANFTPNVTTDSNRKQQTRRTSSRLAKRNLEFDDEDPLLSSNDKKRIQDEFRSHLKSFMDSPRNQNKTTNTKFKIIQDSPRVDRITMQQGTSAQMEFLVPPKDMDDPIEIRQQIRESLNFDKEVPEKFARGTRTPGFNANANNNGEHPLKGSMLTPPKRSSPLPDWNDQKKAWTPNSPDYDRKRGQRVTTMLVMIIVCVLIAVFIGVYQTEILEFIEKEVKPFVFSAVHSMAQSVKSMQQSIQTMYADMVDTISEKIENFNVEDINESVNDADVTEVTPDVTDQVGEEDAVAVGDN